MSGNVFVQLVTYRELENLKRLIPALLGLPGNYQVLVVNDNSGDGSDAWLRECQAREPRLHLILRPGKMGYGTATIEGFRYVMEHQGEVLVTMDADFSHDMNDIPAMVEKIREADMVIGSRYVGGCRVLNWAPKRVIISVFANTYVKMLLRLPFEDCTSGFRAYGVGFLRKTLDLAHLKSDGYSLLVEILYSLYRKGCRVVEHPIIYSERREGQSKMSGKVIFEAVLNPFRCWYKIGLPI